jgi:hypothetical protein
MKTSTTLLVAVLTLGSANLATTNALACHGGSGYGGYSSHYHPEHVRTVYVREQAVTVAPTFAPVHSVVVAVPGDSGFSICAREYGNPGVWSKVADFNGMPQNLQFTSGMQVRLPVINPNGTFSLSSAPPALAAPPQGFAGTPQGFPQGAPQGFAQGMPQGGQPGAQGGFPQANGLAPQGQGLAPQQLPMGPPQGASFGQQNPQVGPQGPMGAPASVGPQGPVAPQGREADSNNGPSITQRIADQLTGLPGLPNGEPAAANAGSTDRPLPSILIGSLMTINGQQLGDNRGTVRLIVNGSPVALEIVEWSANGAKVRIPTDLPAGIQAQIEILRADGSVVAKDPVQLAAGQKVAAAN